VKPFPVPAGCVDAGELDDDAAAEVTEGDVAAAVEVGDAAVVDDAVEPLELQPATNAIPASVTTARWRRRPLVEPVSSMTTTLSAHRVASDPSRGDEFIDSVPSTRSP
jgi:hypothetical protein